jgi:RHS repeat-associated protein
VKRTETREADRTDPNDPAAVISLSGTSVVGSGKAWRSEYVTATRTVTVTSPEGRVLRRMLDDRGRVVRVEAPSVLPFELSYDAEGRVRQLQQGARTASLSHGADGFLAAVEDAGGRKTAWVRDAAGRAASVVLPGGRTVGFAFDPNNNPAALTPPGRTAHGFGYTLDNLLETAKAPDNPPVTYSYDGDRALATVTREDGQTVTVSFDSAGRWKETQQPGGAIGAAYDMAGRLSALAGPGSAKLTFVRDGRRLTDVVSEGPAPGMVTFTYDTRGRLSREKVGTFGGHDLAVEYDEDDLPVSFGPVKMGRDSATGWLSTLQLAGTYQTIDRAVTENGQTTSYGEPTHWRVSLNGAAIYDLALERDLLGRVTKRTELIEDTTRAFTYGYDESGRLSTVTEGGALRATYTYDANGNRLTEDGTTLLGVVDGQDRLTAYGNATYGHDELGNRTKKTDGGLVTTYEHAVGVRGGPLTKVVMQAKIIAYETDALGRRARRRENGVATHGYLYGRSLGPSALLDPQGNIIYRFVYATGRATPEAAIDASGVSYALITDQVGSLRLVVRASDGAIVQRMRHDPWGRIEEDYVAAGLEPMPFGFAGGVFDRDTGLVHFGAREYDPSVGRWVEKDPSDFAGGDTNVYAYVGGRTVDRVDPSGLKPLDRFNTSEEAAIDAVQEYLPFTRGNATEVGGFIFQDPMGYFFYIDPVIGGRYSVNYSRQRFASCHAVAGYHTHPFRRDGRFSQFSGAYGTEESGDRDAFRVHQRETGRYDYIGYLGTAEGWFGAYEVSSQSEWYTQLPNAEP